jgi:uncharacterized protein
MDGTCRVLSRLIICACREDRRVATAAVLQLDLANKYRGRHWRHGSAEKRCGKPAMPNREGRITLAVNVLKFMMLVLATLPALSMAETEQSVELATPEGYLSGTLTLPEAIPREGCPVVLIIAGSGPTDRDGYNRLDQRHIDSYRQLAKALGSHGIASLRYDKRGVGESRAALVSESQLKFEDFVSDAVAWGALLRRDSRFSSVIFLGHSEGSLIGIMAARRLPADAVVSLEGAGEPISNILERQLEAQLPPDLYEQAHSIISSLERGQKVEEIPPGLAMLFRHSVQSYDISWFGLDPRKEIHRLRVPILIVQGEADTQVGTDNAQQLESANPQAKLLMLPDMGHLLVDIDAQTANLGNRSSPSSTIDPRLTEGLVSFIKEVTLTKEKMP